MLSSLPLRLSVIPREGQMCITFLSNFFFFGADKRRAVYVFIVGYRASDTNVVTTDFAKHIMRYDISRDHAGRVG